MGRLGKRELVVAWMWASVTRQKHHHGARAVGGMEGGK